MLLFIDAGHGMSNRTFGRFDPGAVSGGVFEADIVLQWALSGRFVLGRMGVDTLLSRSDNSTHVPLGVRVRRAREAGCTHFLSLHCNAGGGTGTETWFGDREWASRVHRCAVSALGLRDRGIKRGSFAVLSFGRSCLLELGFIDDPQDRLRMLDRNVRIAFWEALGRTFR